MVPFKSGLLIILLVLSFGNTEDLDDCERCTFDKINGNLKCTDLNITEETTIINLNCTIPADQRNLVDYLIIENSTIHTLNIEFIDANELSSLTGVGIHEANITNVIGEIPCRITRLNLSNNRIRNFNATFQSYEIDRDFMATLQENNRSTLEPGRIYKRRKPKILLCTKTEDFMLDLSNNQLEELPVSILESKRLKSLHLAENPLKCEFIWETVWDYLKCQYGPAQCSKLFIQQNSTKCQFYRHEQLPSGIFNYNLAEIFSSKSTLEAECSEMNKTCDCHPFNLLREPGGSLTAYLSVNCFGKNLTQLPKISQYTWELNVSHNHIGNLAMLNSSLYNNLRRLDLSNNLVTNLKDLTNSGFVKKFDLLYINSNKFRKIPSDFFMKVKTSVGKAYLQIGSQLECDCHTATETKGRIIEMQNNILDLNDVVCQNRLRSVEEHESDTEVENKFLRLKDLRITDVCSINTTENESFNWILVLIIFELLCIFGIILKVFYDWRNYQKTGILPWIAEKLPRLPCDGILE